jgi:phosphohistidine phosphatase
MQRLILLRHGKAESDAPSGDDFDRPLAPRGVREAAAMGAHLARAGFAPDVALVSSALRTRQTWEAAQPAFPETYARFERELYHADPAVVRRLAAEAGIEAGTVMMVGHNPGLQDLTVRLMTEGGAKPEQVAGAMRRFPTATASVFRIDTAGKLTFEVMYRPEREA